MIHERFDCNHRHAVVVTNRHESGYWRKNGDGMMTLLAAGAFGLLILTALYAFGFFATPYSNAFRFAFYLIMLVFAVMIVYALGDHPFEGYDPTPDASR